MSSYFDEASLVMIPSGYKNQKVYSVKPLDGSGDLTFSRASSATRVASNGLIEKVRTNLATYSSDFASSGSPIDATVSTNTTTDPFGTSLADSLLEAATTGNHLWYRDFTVVNGYEVTFSVYVKSIGGRNVRISGSTGTGSELAVVDLSNGSILASSGAVSVTSVGSGWYRISVTTTSTGTTVRFIAYAADGTSISYAGNTSKGIYLFGQQLEYGVMTAYIATTSAAVSVGPVSGLPRLDYLGSTCPKILLEPSRTNTCLWSEQFNNAGWSTDNSGGTGTITRTANYATSPDGTTNADRIQITRGSIYANIFQSVSTTVGQTYTASVYLKSLSGTPAVSMLYADTAYRKTLTTEWARYTVTFTATGTSAAPLIGLFAGDAASCDVLAYGYQFELGAYASSYIPTLGTSVTRVADAASKTGISSLIGQTEGTLFVDLTEVNDLDFPEITIDNNNNTDRIVLTRSAAGNWGIFVASSAASTYSVYSTTSSSSGKFALAYSSAGYTLYRNGVQIVTGTYNLPTALSAVRLNGRSSSDFYATKKVGQLVIFPTRLSNSDLAALTA